MHGKNRDPRFKPVAGNFQGNRPSKVSTVGLRKPEIVGRI
jgi:hypothetical protein